MIFCLTSLLTPNLQQPQGVLIPFYIFQKKKKRYVKISYLMYVQIIAIYSHLSSTKSAKAKSWKVTVGLFEVLIVIACNAVEISISLENKVPWHLKNVPFASANSKLESLNVNEWKVWKGKRLLGRFFCIGGENLSCRVVRAW